MQFDLPLTGLNGCGVGFVIQSLFPSESKVHCHINLVLTTNKGVILAKAGILLRKRVILAKAGILSRKESSSRRRGSC
jgi:hypothetical protein